MKPANKIPTLNQDFDLGTFFTVLKKNLVFIAVFFVVATCCGYLYNRYKQPLFNSTSIIQIKKENKTKEILGISEGVKIAPTLEVMRSSEFLKTVINNLPLDVSFFTEGTFLRYENYGNQPFSVKYENIENAVYDKKIYYKLSDDKSGYIINIGEKGSEHIIPFNTPTAIPEGATLTLSPPIYNFVDGNASLRHSYFFVINSDKSIMNELANGLNISILNENAGTIQISYDNDNARKSADIANAIAEQFIDFDLMKNRESSLSTIAYIDEQMNNLVDELSQTERQLQQFRIDNGITNEAVVTRKNDLISEKISHFEQRITDIDFEIETMKEVKLMMQNDVNVSIYELLALMAGQESNAFIGPMLNSLQSLLSKREMLLFEVTENNHNIKVVDKQIEAKRATILEFLESSIVRMNKEKQDCLQRYANMKSEILDKASYDELEYSKLKRVYAINESYYSQLLQAKTDLLISQSGNISTNLVLQKADVPVVPVAPVMAKSLGTALLLALVVSLLFLFVRYMFYNKISTTKDIDRFTTIPIIGEVLTSRHKTEHSQAVVHLNTSSHITECFRKIRTNLDFYPLQGKSRIILTTSTVPSEGKTFVALNLADIYALTNKRVLLVDFDLRKPRIDECLKLNNDDGVTTILTNRKTWQECVHHNVIDNIDVITSGPISPVAAELLAGDEFDNFVAEIRNAYDIIIFDTSPVGLIHDAVSIARSIDNFIYVMRSGISVKGYIEFLNNFKEKHQIKNVSIVLNGLPTNKSTSYGYYKNGYYKNGYGYYSKEV